MKNPYGGIGMGVTQEGCEQIRGHQRAWIKPPKKASKGSLAMEPKGLRTRGIQSMSWSKPSSESKMISLSNQPLPATS